MQALPIAMLAFGYQVIVPSIYKLSRRSARSTVVAITIGSLLPLVLYVLWMVEIFAIFPVDGHWGLHALRHAKDPAAALVASLSHMLPNSWVVQVVSCFVFSAILTSFFGVILSLFDLWVDALALNMTQFWRWGVAGLTIIPALIFSLIYPSGFMMALQYAAIFVAVLSGLLPIAMVMVMRHQEVLRTYHAPISMLFCMGMGCFFLFIILVSLCSPQ
jgi:tyrosine-specific transport protein